MASLTKVWAAFFYEKGSKKPFATNKIVSKSYDGAESLAMEWGIQKWNSRLHHVKIEKSKGEVIADDSAVS